jgi:hypothetical protein
VDIDAIIFNPISSTILKWLRFKVVSWGHDFQPCTAIVHQLVKKLCLDAMKMVNKFNYIR